MTGTFGELRSDHFHAGLDFRAAVGTPVLAVADGFVSRVIVSAGGYGQAVYLDHPDGHRSVYAHLERLAPELLDTVRARQFTEESFVQDMRFDSTAFPVRRGQAIGAVGNRGYSFGPHLHFEMREQAGDVAINPLAFGFDIADTRQPAIRKLRVYGYGREDDQAVWQRDFTPERVREGEYIVRDTIRMGTPLIDFALKAYDRQNAMPNWNGIYGGELLVDSTVWFDFAFDRIPFEETEYLNALTDFADWTENTSWFHRYHALTERQFMARPQDAKVAVPRAVRGRPDYRFPAGATEVRLRVRDYAGNVSVIRCVVSVEPLGDATRPLPHQYFLPGGEPSIIDNGAMRLELDSSALYEDCYFRYARLNDESAGRLSDVHQLHLPNTPLHGRARLAIRPTRPVPDSLRAHAFLGSCNADGRWTSNGGRWTEDGRLAATIGTFGDYALFLDTIPPTVEINYFSTDLCRAAGFSLFVRDNVDGRLPTYRATVDGRWILLEHDAKSDKLSYSFTDGDFSEGEHLFEITVNDGRGNETVWRRGFRR